MTMNEIIFDETNGMIFDEFIQNYPDFVDVLKKYDTDTFPNLVEGVTLFQNAKNEIEESEIANRIQDELFHMVDGLNYEIIEPNEEVKYYKIKEGAKVQFVWEDRIDETVTSTDFHMESSWLMEIRNLSCQCCEQSYVFRHMRGCGMVVLSSDIEELNYVPSHFKDIH